MKNKRKRKGKLIGNHQTPYRKIFERQSRFSNEFLQKSLSGTPSSQLKKFELSPNYSKLVEKQSIFSNENLQKSLSSTPKKSINSFQKLQRTTGKFVQKKKRRPIQNPGKYFSEAFLKKQQKLYEGRVKRELNKKLARRVVDHWKKLSMPRIMALRRQKKHDEVILRKYFQKMRSKSSEKRSLLKKEFVARTSFHFYLKVKYFRLWNEKMKLHWIYRYEIERKLEVAGKFYRVKLLEKSLKCLRWNVEARKKKRANLEKAMCFSWLKLATKVFLILKNYSVGKRQKRKVYDFVEKRYCLYLKRIYYKKWKKQRVWQGRLRILEKKSDAHFENGLKCKVFKVLKEMLIMKMKRLDEEKYCQEIYRRFLVKKFFRRWRYHLRDLIEQRLREKEEMAMDIFQTNLKRKYFFLWVERKEERIHEKRSLELSEKFFFQRRGRIYFTLLRRYAIHSKKKRILKKFCDDVFCRKFFFKWRNSLYVSLRRKQLIKSVDGQYEEELKKRYFTLWKKKKFEIESERISLNCADDFRRKMLQRKFFNQLVKHWLNQRRRKFEEIRAENLYSSVLKKKYFDKLRRRYNEQLKIVEHLKNSSLFYRSNLKRKCFVFWKEYVLFRKEKRLIMNRTVELVREKLLLKKKRRIFEILKRWFYQKNKMRIINTKASSFSNRKIITKYFLDWVKFTNLQKEYRCLEHRANEIYVRKLKIRYFDYWYSSLVDSRSEKKKEQKAILFNEERIIHKSMHALKMNVKKRKLNKQLMVEANDRRRKYLLKKGVRNWVESSVESKKKRFTENYPMKSFQKRDVLEKYAIHWKYLSRSKKRLFRKPYPMIPFSMKESKFKGLSSLSEKYSDIRPPVSNRPPPRMTRIENIFSGSRKFTDVRRNPKVIQKLDSLDQSDGVARDICGVIREQDERTRKIQLELRKTQTLMFKQKNELNMEKRNRIKRDIEKIEKALLKYKELKEVFLKEKSVIENFEREMKTLLALNNGNETVAIVRIRTKLSHLKGKEQMFLKFKREKIPKMKKILVEKYLEYKEILNSEKKEENYLSLQ